VRDTPEYDRANRIVEEIHPVAADALQQAIFDAWDGDLEASLNEARTLITRYTAKTCGRLEAEIQLRLVNSIDLNAIRWESERISLGGVA